MLQAVLVWSGLVLAFSLLLVMALGPVAVELDSWWYERKRRERGGPVAARRVEVSANAGGEVKVARRAA